jgi:hypothetical protein
MTRRGQGWSDEAVLRRCHARGGIDLGTRYNDAQIKGMAEAARSVDAHMLAGGWVQMLNYPTPGPGTSTGTFTTLQALTPTQEVTQVVAGSSHIGTCFHLMATGIYGSAATAPTMQVGIGLNNVAPTTWVTAATTVRASQTVATWELAFWAIVLTIGATGTIQGAGNITNIGSATGTTTAMPDAQATALTWNTTVNNCFNVGASFGTSSASNLIQVNQFQVLQLN